MGIAKSFKDRGVDFKVITLEPASSPILSKRIKGARNVEGVGLDFIPAIYNSEYVDDVISIEESLARQTCKELASKEGIFCGTLSGMNVEGAIKLSKRLGPKSKVVAVTCDTGLKYLSKGLFS